MVDATGAIKGDSRANEVYRLLTEQDFVVRLVGGYAKELLVKSRLMNNCEH